MISNRYKMSSEDKSQRLFEREFANQEVDRKCFILNINRLDFEYVKRTEWRKSEEGNVPVDKESKNYIQKTYSDNKGVSYKKTSESTICRDIVVYAESLSKAREKVLEVVKTQMPIDAAVSLDKKIMSETKRIENDKRKKVDDVDRKIKNKKDEINSVADKARAISYYEHQEKNEKKYRALNEKCHILSSELEELEIERSKVISSQSEDAVRVEIEEIASVLKDIIVADIDDYKIEIEENKYIILKSVSAIALTKNVNDHLGKCWNILGGVQIASAGGGESVHSWSEALYAQSLTCGKQ